MAIPFPIANLMQEEDSLRADALQWISQSTELSHHMAMISLDMDAVWQAAKQDALDEESQTIQKLGYRVFNHMASALRLALGGYFQASVMLQRDLYETSWLISYLMSFPDKIAVWLAADDHKKRREFEPNAIRKALNERDAFATDDRSRLYWALSDYAAHPSAKGFLLLAPPGEEARCGPFLTEQTLGFAMHELAKTFNVAANNVALFLDMAHPETNAIARELFVAINEWNERFLGAPFSDEQRDKIASLER